MEGRRPFAVRYGEGLIVAGILGMLGRWYSATRLDVFLAGCTAATIGALLLWRARRKAPPALLAGDDAQNRNDVAA